MHKVIFRIADCEFRIHSHSESGIRDFKSRLDNKNPQTVEQKIKMLLFGGMDLQPSHLRNNLVILTPLQSDDFEGLYEVASDPLVWEQHPNPDRYKKEVFRNYFKGAMESGGALLIRNAVTGEIIGCSRYYDHIPEKKELKIGYTFFGRSSWGKGFNRATKDLMIHHAFTGVDTIIFHVGVNNLRSRKAMEKLGAELTGFEEIAYYGEPTRQNCVYTVRKEMI
jgi:RimJ/RimL family protein N-acetyltransferase